MTVADPLVQATLLGEATDRGPVLVFVVDDDMKYVAVNQYAADVLGYSREELLALKATDVARGRTTVDEFADFVAHRHQDGLATLARKDGSELTVAYRATETRVAGMPMYVSVGWIVD